MPKNKISAAAICMAACLGLTACGGSTTVSSDVTQEGKELLSDGIESGELVINEAKYAFPAMLSDWLDSGWHISYDYENVDTFQLDSYYESDIFELFLDDECVMMAVYNDSKEALPVKECMVSYLSVNMTDFEAVLPGGLTRNSSLEDVIVAYGEPEDKETDSMYEILYYQYEKNLNGYSWLCDAAITVYQSGVTDAPLARVEFALSDDNWEEE